MNKVRHVLGISGGKDSAALAIYMKDNYPNDTYYYELTFFTGDKNESGTNSKVVIGFHPGVRFANV